MRTLRLLTHKHLIGDLTRGLAVVAAALVVGVADALAASGGGHGGGHGTSSGINWWAWDAHSPPVGWALLNFAIFLVILVRAARRPLASAFAQRHATVKRSIDESASAHRQAQERYDDYRTRRAGVDQEAAQLVERAAAEGQTEKARMAEDAQAYAQRLRQDSASAAEQESARALLQLRREAAHQALDLAEKLLRETLTQADRQRLFERSVAELQAAVADKTAAARQPEREVRRAVGGAA